MVKYLGFLDFDQVVQLGPLGGTEETDGKVKKVISACQELQELMATLDFLVLEGREDMLVKKVTVGN